MAIDLGRPTRRELIMASGVLFAWAYLPKLARAEGRDPRLLVFVLRGALDGLATVAPVGDPNWPRLRGAGAIGLTGTPAALPLNGFFALNPAMPQLHKLYGSGEAIVFHATTTPYRERSHFDGQDVLESGVPKPGSTDSGWLNRALSAMTPEGRVRREKGALAVGPVPPLLVRGAAPIMSWVPQKLPETNQDTLMRLLDLYRHTDPRLAQIMEERIGIEAIAQVASMQVATSRRDAKAAAARINSSFAESAGAAARFLSQSEGPRVGAIVFDGWDTHAHEGEADGRLSHLLAALDGAIGAVKTGMGDAWKETVVVVVTEFGRTARMNGTMGTDHGTATVALLAGGALKGGRVIADWPGLQDRDLLDGRDLKPTIDLRTVLKGVLRDHLRIVDSALDTTVFPQSAKVRPMSGLVV